MTVGPAHRHRPHLSCAAPWPGSRWAPRWSAAAATRTRAGARGGPALGRPPPAGAAHRLGGAPSRGEREGQKKDAGAACTPRDEHGLGPHTGALASSRVGVDLELDHRRKGLLWYDTYGVGFAGRYGLRNADAQPRTLVVALDFPSADAPYDGFGLQVDGGTTPPVATYAGPPRHRRSRRRARRPRSRCATARAAWATGRTRSCPRAWPRCATSSWT